MRRESFGCGYLKGYCTRIKLFCIGREFNKKVKTEFKNILIYADKQKILDRDSNYRKI